ncbi:MAG: hypothetical protein HUU20_15230 [Pirellulales bacterium]|nr:hypothetical protein [Pirellulales bacterium]
MFRTNTFLLSLIFAVLAASSALTAAADMPVEEAWKALPTYQYGQDIAPLLVLDRAVIEAMTSPASRSACAARLASLLESAQTTPAARQYICNQLRQVGTAAEVPVLARLLANEETSEMARHALETIPGEQPLAALRAALTTLKGRLRIGVINSLAARKDAASVADLKSLAAGEDQEAAAAALWALGNIGGDEAAAFLAARAEKSPVPVPQALAVPLLRCGDALAAAGKLEQAGNIYRTLSQAGQLPGVRRAALQGLLGLEKQDRTAAILAWFGDTDPDRRRVAAGELGSLPDERLDRAAERLGQLPAASQRALIEVLAIRRGRQALPLVLSIAKSDKPELRLAGIHYLGTVGDASVVPLLVDTLAAGGDLTQAAQQSLASLPRKDVGPAMLEALNARPEIRTSVIDVLKTLRYYEALDPLVAIAAQKDPAVYGPALDGLRGIADPDKTDLPRLVKLLLGTEPGPHREEVEKTILIVCEKLPAGADRAEPVLTALGDAGTPESAMCLPLLGRLGGPKVLARIESALKQSDPQIQEAAVRALCNWPNADVADRLKDVAKHSENESFRRRALRAYVRVVTLKSERPESQTLTMLQDAMGLARNPEDTQLILERASTVRTMESVLWIASYLDNPAASQAACLAIVELAHHRFLRHPNMDQFGPILDKVGKIARDPAVVERARRYRLGL